MSACEAVACVSSCQTLPWMIDVKPSCAYRLTFFQTLSTDPQVVSTITQPMSAEALHVGRGHAEGRQHDHVLRAERRARRVGVAEKLDALGAEAVVDVRVVDDLAGEKHAAIRKPLARLIGVVDRAVDAVAEPELAREMDRETPGPVLEVVGLDLLDQIAVVVLVQLGRDRVFQVEAFSEHERRGGHYRT